MSKDWIENLAHGIKQKNHEAAESYGRQHHNAGIIADLGMPFFTALVSCLEDDINEIRHQLQGDVTSSETAIQTINANDVKLTRSRFPWFDAHVTHQDSVIILDYAKDRGIAGDPTLAERRYTSLSMSQTTIPSLFRRPSATSRANFTSLKS